MVTQVVLSATSEEMLGILWLYLAVLSSVCSREIVVTEGTERRYTGTLCCATGGIGEDKSSNLFGSTFKFPIRVVSASVVVDGHAAMNVVGQTALLEQQFLPLATQQHPTQRFIRLRSMYSHTN